MSQWSYANGRYAAACEAGHCALTGGQATSKLEGQIFALLNLVLGPGDQDLRPGRGYRVDMHFPLDEGGSLVVEYDGAYWHSQDTERDLRKNEYLAYTVHGPVVRIREYPLKRLTQLDVIVPPRADAFQCARLVALHLMHMETAYLRLRGLGLGDPYDGPLVKFLALDQRPISWKEVACRKCRGLAEKVLHQQALNDFRRRSAGPPFWRRTVPDADRPLAATCSRAQPTEGGGDVAGDRMAGS